MGREHEYAGRELLRPEQYDGEETVAVSAWPAANGEHRRRSERLAILDEWIAFFGTPSPVRHLSLTCRVTDVLLGALAPQIQLESLALKWGPYRDLRALEEMEDLRCLELGGASALVNLSPLRHLTQLRKLEVSNARALTDYAPLAELSELRFLNVHRGITGARSNADSLDFVRGFAHLDELWWDPRVTSADYSPLLHLTSAKKVSVTPMKGMTPAHVDLEWALPGMRAVLEERAAHRIPVISSTGEVAVLTTDVTSRTVWVAAEPTDEIDEEWHFPPGREAITAAVSGRTIRTFASTARTRTERFWLQLESPQTSDQSPPLSESVVATFPFSGDASGPILVWDSALPACEDIADFFSGNTDAWTYSPPLRLDATHEAALPDDEFWELVGAFGGRANLMSTYKAVAALATRGEQVALRWAHAFSDHALRVMPRVEALAAKGHVPPDRIFEAVGAIVVAGRTTYGAILADADSFDRRLLREAALDVIFTAQLAVRRLRPEVESVTTPLSLLWDSGPAAQKTRRLLTERDPSFTRMHCARGILRIDGQLHERLVLVDWGDETDEHSTTHAIAALKSFGGHLVAGPEFAEGAVNHLANAGAVFHTRRRSSMPVAEYLAIYAPGDGG
ncbi:hypothetical protein [Microbacterium sp. VKM Ac-2923]|uniref:hypothetical protein n=1 Tax=Microbacterium sp. VKM Ac-2923 TaxID=2929476 RepID=UPI001FB41E4E|nr:hypothetical protein [Microbacterium sp. VKM Ac-2923]MCJ1706243.1 hypothetical protein [Microbacterium sp. VKM Ac-2923]